jgi:hypothetical protein
MLWALGLRAQVARAYGSDLGLRAERLRVRGLALGKVDLLF